MHLIIILDAHINCVIKLLIELGQNKLAELMTTLRDKANELDAKLQRNAPPIPPLQAQQMHDLLVAITDFVKPMCDDEDFFDGADFGAIESQTDSFIAQANAYL